MFTVVLELFSFELRNSYYNKLVNANTVNRLIQLNDQFYQTFALQFSLTRQRLQPGVHKILNDGLSPTHSPSARMRISWNWAAEMGSLLVLWPSAAIRDAIQVSTSIKLLEQARQSLSERIPGQLH
jgi:hypothetical protein